MPTAGAKRSTAKVGCVPLKTGPLRAKRDARRTQPIQIHAMTSQSKTVANGYLFLQLLYRLIFKFYNGAAAGADHVIVVFATADLDFIARSAIAKIGCVNQSIVFQQL